MTNVLYNPLADNKRGEENAKKIKEILKNAELKFADITKIDLHEFINNVPQKDKIIIAGGDGTLNYLVNKFSGNVTGHSLYYYASGNGNDFKVDISEKEHGEIIRLDKYIKDLPIVYVNGGKGVRFLNGVGFGIDGYCCEVGDEMKKKSAKSINYTSIAIKGMLYDYKPRNAVVTVDGVKHKYNNVWLVPTMNGRYYGGGMKVAPDQDRLTADRMLTTMVFHCKSKLKTLTVFPTIFKGKHVEHTDIIDMLTGREITVEFDKPTPLQVDGETYKSVSHYNAFAKLPEDHNEDNETAANV